MPKTILLRSGWQTVNIGDIAHTPGALALIRQYMPNAHVILWASRRLDRGAGDLLRRTFPDVEIVDAGNEVALNSAFDRADLFIHGSGSNFPGRLQANRWHEATGKPFGLLGVTVERPEESVDLLNAASFIFTRETASLKVLGREGITCPIQAFAPDATFAMAIRDDAGARSRMAEHSLEPGRFLCIVPRMRYTPYHRIRKNHGWDPQRIQFVEQHNAQHTPDDVAKLARVIERWVEETGDRVFLVPEMTYQTEMFSAIVDPLPTHIASHVEQLNGFWLPDEAASLYDRSNGVVSSECHSPIMSLHAGSPALYVRQPEDTIKGQMYRDLWLSDWILEIDGVTGDTIADRILVAHGDPEGARTKVSRAMNRARQLHDEAMHTIADLVQSL
ncbi:MAG: polysaccharide pyruvyl transferase [Gemmatimonadetes bacterium]|nr:polysaccharide pyruvyl transferase [Gemmatimonadota bacterium]|tara:strand:+ start:7763 stop:8929 length:1167 start_codon:yes stop_codon:yes gene_type:complete